MPTFDAQSRFQKIPVAGLALENTATDLPTPVEGLTEVRTDTHSAWIYLGGTWVRLDNAGISGTPSGPAGGSLAGTYPNPTIAPNAITTAEILDGTIANADIANNAINSAKIADGTVLVTDLDVTSVRLNTIGTPNGIVDMNFQRLVNLTTPTAPNDAANKDYVDTVAQGLDAKASVRAATTANITLSGTQTIDGIAVVAGDRVLVKNQTDTTQNGIYVVASGAWTRSTDMDAGAEFPSAFTFVEQGAVNADTGWVCTTNAPVTVGTTAITWTQFSGAGTIIDGAGLLKTGNTLDVRVDGTSIAITSDILGVAPNGITNAMIADGAINLNSADVTGTLPLSAGGTGANNAPTARIALGAAGMYSVASPALTAGVWTAIPHTLAARARNVAFEEVSSLEGRMLDWRVTSANPTTSVDIRCDIAGGRAAGYYNVNVFS